MCNKTFPPARSRPWKLVWMICLPTWLLLSNCAKPMTPSLLQEDRLFDPQKLGCQCPEIDLNNFLLIGKKKLAEVVDALNFCHFEKVLEQIPDE